VHLPTLTLRARLLLAMGMLLALALVVSGGLVVGITRQSLVDQLDNDLRNASSADFDTGSPTAGPGPTGRRFALMIFDSSGTLVSSLPSGFGGSPDPLPAVTARNGQPSTPVGQIVTEPAVGGSIAYRVLTVRYANPIGNGFVWLVLAAPLAEVDASVGLLLRALVAVGLAVLGLMLVVGWLIVRRDLKPLEQITGTAERISDGDLSQRVGVPDDGSEVGRLGNAFDQMLDQIQAGFESQRAALWAKERSESQLRQFVADAGHELRTPLTTLRGYADLYRAGGLDDEAALEQAMNRIGTESRRMGTLVEDLLLLARLDQGRPLRSESVVLSDLVRDAINDAQAVEPARPIRAQVEEAVKVTGDEDRLRQVVGNLFANVRVHTPPDTPVDVTLSSRNGVAVLEVADHGPGIDAGHREHIFDRFYRADIGRSRDRGGSGLGLAIAASVTAAHAGTISHSETPGGGATFTLTLPRS
jgi:two-component system OmpR family sensor kinase